MAFVGIDLGTTFSVVAHIDRDGQPRVIPNESGQNITPSVVYFAPDGPVVGSEAKERQAMGEKAIGAFFKRYMDSSHFELMYHGQSYNPTRLSALILQYLRKQAETYLGEPVTHAVITVPAYFYEMPRKATMEAARLAGLQVLRIINEPTAAAFAYGMRPTSGEQKVLVYDLGGGTFDVTILRITPTEQEVLGTGGDHRLGGKDWDDCIVQYLSNKFEDEFGIGLDADAFNELLVMAESLKKSLTARQTVSARVQGSGHTGTYELTRAKFEELTAHLMQRTQQLVENVLRDTGLSWGDLGNVLLVGGSTRMPMVHSFVEAMSGKAPSRNIDPDEAVALGAAIQAAMDMEELEELRLPGQAAAPTLSLAGRKRSIDVISHSLGMIATSEDQTRYLNSIIIAKNATIPRKETRPYSLRTGRRGDSQLDVYMTQGEMESPMDCVYLGKYVFSNIPQVNDDRVTLDVSYEYDRNGMVHVSAVERSSGRSLTLAIEPLPDDVPDRFTLPPELHAAREHLTVYLAFDLSGSMSGAPLREAQRAAHAFMKECDLSNTSIGLIGFSDSVLVELEASQNAKKIGAAIDGMACGRTGYGNGTHPFDELFKRLHTLKGARYGLVLADGVWSYQGKAIKQAKKCHAAEIEIIGIGFGGADRAFLKAISSSDEQSIFTDMNKLTATFSTIAQELTERGGKLRQ
jgi:molecular chaperone DnaK (HSP70)